MSPEFCNPSSQITVTGSRKRQKSKPQKDKPCPVGEMSLADSAEYALDFVGYGADATSIVAEWGAGQAGELTPPALFFHTVAAVSNGVSRLTSVGTGVIHIGQGDWRALGGDIVGALTAHSVGHIVGKAMKGAKQAKAVKDASKTATNAALDAGGGC